MTALSFIIAISDVYIPFQSCHAIIVTAQTYTIINTIDARPITPHRQLFFFYVIMPLTKVTRETMGNGKPTVRAISFQLFDIKNESQ
jgi:hypothetical protein